jgi:hypothetical protein
MVYLIMILVGVAPFAFIIMRDRKERAEEQAIIEQRLEMFCK